MSELDEQMREVQDITDVLANPLGTGAEGERDNYITTAGGKTSVCA